MTEKLEINKLICKVGGIPPTYLVKNDGVCYTAKSQKELRKILKMNYRDYWRPIDSIMETTKIVFPNFEDNLNNFVKLLDIMWARINHAFPKDLPTSREDFLVKVYNYLIRNDNVEELKVEEWEIQH